EGSPRRPRDARQIRPRRRPPGRLRQAGRRDPVQGRARRLRGRRRPGGGPDRETVIVITSEDAEVRSHSLRSSASFTFFRPMQWCDLQNRLLLFGFSGLLLALHVDFPYLAVVTGFACAIAFYAVETYVYPRLKFAGSWRTTLRGALIFIAGEGVGMLTIG